MFDDDKRYPLFPMPSLQLVETRKIASKRADDLQRALDEYVLLLRSRADFLKASIADQRVELAGIEAILADCDGKDAR